MKCDSLEPFTEDYSKENLKGSLRASGRHLPKFRLTWKGFAAPLLFL